jgi:L-ascorbate metabolism protein UlaG (beta-lactamase superfamily)
MRIQLLRHATLIVEYAGKRLLVDPMLSRAGEMAPIQNAPNPQPNPMVELPIPAEEMIRDIDAVLVTHTHRDHWDDAAAKLLPKSLPIYGQPEDEAKFFAAGFKNLFGIEGNAEFGSITIHRTGGEHGTGEIAKAMAPVSGFVLEAEGEPRLYIAGDTVWCTVVSDALTKFQPNVIVLNAGGARFLEGDPITMTGDDVVDVCQAAPASKVIAVHMEAINHCLLTRAQLREHLKDIHVNEQVSIPADGEVVSFSSRPPHHHGKGA